MYHTPQTDYLLISYTDTLPDVCAAAVQSLTAAYSQVYDTESQEYLKQRTAELQARRVELSKKISDLDLKISAAAGSAGTANADHLYDAAVQRFTNMETLVAQARVELATAEGERGQVGRTAQNIDAIEGQIASLNELRDQSKQEMTELGQKRLEMDRLRTAKEPIEKELEETDQGIDALQFESGIGGRLVVVTAGETPLAPFDDKKNGLHGSRLSCRRPDSRCGDPSSGASQHTVSKLGRSRSRRYSRVAPAGRRPGHQQQRDGRPNKTRRGQVCPSDPHNVE